MHNSSDYSQISLFIDWAIRLIRSLICSGLKCFDFISAITTLYIIHIIYIYIFVVIVSPATFAFLPTSTYWLLLNYDFGYLGS